MLLFHYLQNDVIMTSADGEMAVAVEQLSA